jgi:hypothetical protein
MLRRRMLLRKRELISLAFESQSRNSAPVSAPCMILAPNLQCQAASARSVVASRTLDALRGGRGGGVWCSVERGQD